MLKVWEKIRNIYQNLRKNEWISCPPGTVRLATPMLLTAWYWGMIPNITDVFAGKVMTAYSNNWFTLLLLCTSASLVLCCDQLDHGSRLKCEPLDLVTEHYEITLSQQIVLWIFRESVHQPWSYGGVVYVYSRKRMVLNTTHHLWKFKKKISHRGMINFKR